MDNKRAHLAEDSVGNVAWALSRHTNGQAILATFLGDDIKGIQPVRCVFVTKTAIQELMCFIKEDEQWRITE